VTPRGALLLAAALLVACGGTGGGEPIPASADEVQPASAPPPAAAAQAVPAAPPATPPSPPDAVPTIAALPDPSTFPSTDKGLVNGAFAPELARPDLLGGGAFALSEHVGPTASRSETRVAVVGMVASWCGPCAASLPFLAQMKEQHGDGLAIVLVATDTDLDGRKKEAEKVRAAGLDAVVLDPTEDDLRAWMGARRNVPHFYIVNKVGEVLVQDRGFGSKVRKVMPGQLDYAMRHPEYVARRKPAAR
jgi:thiol-disulfide isomerase/thioredoxin